MLLRELDKLERSFLRHSVRQDFLSELLLKGYSVKHTVVTLQVKTCGDGQMRNIHQQYHRRSRRVTMGEPVKLRPSSPSGESLEEIATTRNVSREGFYFLTKRDYYQEGMRLFVTLPYHSPADLHDREYVGQVARVELLDGDERGVGVQLLSSLTANPPTRLPGSSPP